MASIRGGLENLGWDRVLPTIISWYVGDANDTTLKRGLKIDITLGRTTAVLQWWANHHNTT